MPNLHSIEMERGSQLAIDGIEEIHLEKFIEKKQCSTNGDNPCKIGMGRFIMFILGRHGKKFYRQNDGPF